MVKSKPVREKGLGIIQGICRTVQAFPEVQSGGLLCMVLSCFPGAVLVPCHCLVDVRPAGMSLCYPSDPGALSFPNHCIFIWDFLMDKILQGNTVGLSFVYHCRAVCWAALSPVDIAMVETQACCMGISSQILRL